MTKKIQSLLLLSCKKNRIKRIVEQKKIMEEKSNAEIQMDRIKNGITEVSGAVIFFPAIEQCIEADNSSKYSIYSNKTVASAFRSYNTVKLNMTMKEIEEGNNQKNIASLSFTDLGMENVLKRSEALKAEHQKNLGQSAVIWP